MLSAKLLALCTRLCSLAWPLAGADMLGFAKELIITSYVGHMDTHQLSAMVLGQAVYNITGNAPMLGVVSAMETFAGQAYGAGNFPVVGEVLQQALAVSLLCCCGVLGLWQWTEAVLLVMGQDKDITAAAARFTMALAPALFLDAADQCCRRYLAAQSVVQPSLSVSVVATLLTPVYLDLCCKRLGWGLLGAAAAWNAAQATSLVLIVAYCVFRAREQASSSCRRTWTGWTLNALNGVGNYLKAALPSCIMLCCEWWTMEVIVMLSGLLPNPERAVSTMGITINIHAVAFLAAQGLGGAASVCVAQDLGAGKTRTAWLTVKVAVLLGTLLMGSCSLLLVLCGRHIGWLLSSDKEVVELTAQGLLPVAMSITSEGANVVLAGVMRSSGCQKQGATVSLVTYWLVGLPLACYCAFWLHLGIMGLWMGLIGSAALQAFLNLLILLRLDWVGEATRGKALSSSGQLLPGSDCAALPRHSLHCITHLS